MSGFLNQKEEVLNIDLTKHGRRLLGLGTFQPEYYEFFDDSVIYDLSYGGSTEIQNASQERILNKDLTIRALNVSEDINIAPLGTSSPVNDYAPSWDMNVLNGNITQYVQASSSYHENVFDLNPIKYIISLEDNKNSISNNFNLSTFELENGKTINIDDDYILIEISEENVEDEYQNYVLELETYDELTGGKQGGLSRKLMFLPKQTNIINGLIYDANELPNRFADIKLTKNDVEFYLDILVDEEIDQAIINKTAKSTKPIEVQVKTTYTTTFEGTTKEDC